MLGELKSAAQKIARGETTIEIQSASPDAIGSLTESIAEIARANQELALAAEAMGKGDFSVDVRPRGPSDVLGNAIVRMKAALQAYSEKMESLVKTRTEELERSNEDLQQFAHVASHDLKEPLRKMRIYTGRLLEGTKHLEEKDRDVLYKIDQSANRMTHMIEGILDYSSVNASSEPFELTDLNAIVQNVITDLELLINEKHARVYFKELPQVEGAPILLNQLFYNLINNALKFSRPGVAPFISVSHKKLTGENCLRFDPHHNCYELAISDNGIGFNSEYADKIFNTFSRLHSKKDYEGTGLGLALCKKIIHYHSGKIWAESTGAGATFKMILPQKQETRSLASN